MEKVIDVAAAIIMQDGLIMVARRAKGEDLEQKWEFPGGKIEPDETPEKCLQREMEEEFAIIVQVKNFVEESLYHYPEKSIRLLAYEVVWLDGDIVLRVHDKIDWVSPDSLLKKDMAPADIPIAQALYIQSQENTDETDG